jgi:hypothetical protein
MLQPDMTKLIVDHALSIRAHVGVAEAQGT